MKNTILVLSFILSLGILSLIFANKAEAGSSGFFQDACLAVCVGDGTTPSQHGIFIVVGEDGNCLGFPDTVYNRGKNNTCDSISCLCPRFTQFLYIPFKFG